MGTGLKRIFPAMAVASLVTALMAVTMGGVVRVTAPAWAAQTGLCATDE